MTKRRENERNERRVLWNDVRWSMVRFLMKEVFPERNQLVYRWDPEVFAGGQVGDDE